MSEAADLTNPIFHNEDAARAYFEAIRWPDGKPVCPHCGVIGETTLVKGQSHRPGMYQCNACLKPFTVTVGSVMESSHIPLHKWALGFRLYASSKKGVRAHQLMRSLGIGSYRTAWFMAHRIREAMNDSDPEPSAAKERRSRLTKHSSESLIRFSFPARDGRGSEEQQPSARC